MIYSQKLCMLKAKTLKIVFACLFFIIFKSNNLFALTWTQETVKDDFKGTSFDVLFSEFVKPNYEFDFPYKNLKARIVLYCSNKKVLLIQFNMHPNLTGGDLRDDLSSRHVVDFKIDGTFDKLSGTIKNNGDIFTTFSKNQVQKILSSKDFLIQFDHYAGTRHYKFDMSSMPKNCK